MRFNPDCMDVLKPSKKNHVDLVYIVSGLPRSGTSMMMQMCVQGGLSPLNDGKRKADNQNPFGYYEYEAVKDPSSYNVWIHQAENKIIKVISRFLPSLPATYFYKIIFMKRDISSIIRSQSIMAKKYSNSEGFSQKESELKTIYQNHLDTTLLWLENRLNISTHYVNYKNVINHPKEEAEKIQSFLEVDLDTNKMANSVDQSLDHSNGVVVN